MDFRGQACTLYPVSWEGAQTYPTEFSPQYSADAFQGALVSQMTRAGIAMWVPAAGIPDQSIVIVTRIVRADPGSRAMRWMFSLLAGHAVFEIQGQVGTAAMPIGQFHARGVRRWGWYGGDSQALLSDAAKMAGERAASQIVAMIAAR